MYQYLDNDDDGDPDNALVYKMLTKWKATMFMFSDSNEYDNSPFREMVHKDKECSWFLLAS